MFRRHFLRYRLLYCAHIPGLTNALDEPNPVKFEPKNGRERVMTLFQADEYGDFNKNIISAQQICFGSAFLLGCYGGLRYSKQAFEDYIDAHQLTRYRSAYEAKRLMYDHVVLKFAKYFFIYAVKGYIFTALFSITMLAITLYRDKEGILEYTVGGIVAGSLVRINNGLKGMGAGAFLAGGLATVVGSVIFIVTKLSNMSMQDIRDWQYSWKVWRKEHVLKALDSSKDDPLNDSLRSYVKAMTEKDENHAEKVYVLLDQSEKKK